jgi:hypothetical protein
MTAVLDREAKNGPIGPMEPPPKRGYDPPEADAGWLLSRAEMMLAAPATRMFYDLAGLAEWFRCQPEEARRAAEVWCGPAAVVVEGLDSGVVGRLELPPSGEAAWLDRASKDWSEAEVLAVAAEVRFDTDLAWRIREAARDAIRDADRPGRTVTLPLTLWVPPFSGGPLGRHVANAPVKACLLLRPAAGEAWLRPEHGWRQALRALAARHAYDAAKLAFGDKVTVFCGNPSPGPLG